MAWAAWKMLRPTGKHGGLWSGRGYRATAGIDNNDAKGAAAWFMIRKVTVAAADGLQLQLPLPEHVTRQRSFCTAGGGSSR